MKYKFIQEDDNDYDVVTFEFESGHINEMIEKYILFLLASGYQRESIIDGFKDVD